MSNTREKIEQLSELITAVRNVGAEYNTMAEPLIIMPDGSPYRVIEIGSFWLIGSPRNRDGHHVICRSLRKSSTARAAQILLLKLHADFLSQFSCTCSTEEVGS